MTTLTKQPVITWETSQGSVHILPERGRVLRIEAAVPEALWSPPQVTASWNLGGERLWIGPEADWHWQRLGTPDFAHYKVAPALDPDNWSVEDSREGFFSGLVELAVGSPHRDANVNVRFTRSVELVLAVGRKSVWPMIASIVAPGARLAMTGLFAGEICDVNFDPLVVQEISVLGSLGAPGMWPECISLHQRGLVRTDRIVTHRMPLADFAEAVEISRTRRDGAIKFVLNP